MRLLTILHRRSSALAALLLVSIALLPPAQPVFAQQPAGDAPPLPQLTVIDVPEGAQIQWTTAGATALDSVRAVLPSELYQGFALPMRAIPLRVVGGPDAGVLQIRGVQAVDLPPGALSPEPIDATPLYIDEQTTLPAVVETPQLPSAPAFILSSGTVDGEWIVVVGFSPVYAENGVPKLATALDAVVTGAVRAPDETERDAQMAAASAEAATQDAFSTAPEPVIDPALAASIEEVYIPDAATGAVKLMVSAPGIQRIPRSALGAAWNVNPLPDLKNVRLTFKGVRMPVQSFANEIRFYAPTAGDRWNSADAWLLWMESTASLRSPQISGRALTVPVTAADAAEIEATSSALERGVWVDNKVYDSLYPGNEGDHYFAAKLHRMADADPAKSVTANLADIARIRPANQLPLAKGTQSYTLTLVAVKAESMAFSYPLNVAVSGNTTNASKNLPPVDFSSVDSQKVGFSFPASNADKLTLTLLGGTSARALLLDTVAYQRPVVLNLPARGAIFSGSAGQKTYRWANAPTVGGAYVVWDVTNPAVPVALSGAAAGGFVDTEAARTYVVGGDGFVQTPTVAAWRPIAASQLTPSHVIYVIPNESYRAALQPLVNLRKTQNCRTNVKCVVEVVDVTRIYDGRGYGNISPEAIRLFLRDAYTRFAALPSGSPRFMSLVLVGDATWDPKGFEGKKINVQLMPPYMRENVDRQYGEAPCDRCYGQYLGFNGVLCADPHTCDAKDGSATTFSPEVWQGRLPVKSTAELQTVVAKIVGYETATDLSASWRSRVLYIADNYMKGESGPLPVKDCCDFAARLDDVRALNPNATSGFSTPRLYYDPFPAAQVPSKVGQFWRVSDPKQAWAQTLASLSDGATVSVYYGHATPYTMVRYDLPDAWRFSMLDNSDVPFLQNGKKLYMQLSMTCLASQFARPSDGGNSLDEAIFLRPTGGSVAVWGPSGYGIPYVHDLLLTGYFKKLFSVKGAAQTVGALTDAGYAGLAFNALGHYDMLRTFGIMGDPLTRIRVGPAVYPMFLPTARR